MDPQSKSSSSLNWLDLAILGLISTGFLVCFIWQLEGVLSIAVEDEIAYCTAGVNLLRDGSYSNPYGGPEVWFPPTYPLAIAILSGAGQIEPHEVARWISQFAALGGIWLIWWIGYLNGESRAVRLTAAALLAGNACYQYYASAAMSESLSTFMALLAFACWLRMTDSRWGIWSVGLGLCLSIGGLTRPEVVLLTPLWLLINIMRIGFLRAVMSGTLVAVVMIAVISPYTVFLKRHIGTWSLTGKSQVNLAAGRAQYYHVPREYIDPVRLEMGYYPSNPSLLNEAKRYIAGYGSYGIGFQRIYRKATPLIVVLMAWGMIAAWRQWDRYVTFGCLAQFCYLVVVPIYEVQGERNLHAVLPVLSLFASVGLWRIIFAIRNLRWPAVRIGGQVALAAAVCLVLAEGATRVGRWYGDRRGTLNDLLARAGEELAQWKPTDGIVYERSATVAHYSRRRRGRLTNNDFGVILKYIDKVESPETPVFLALVVGSDSQKKREQELLGIAGDRVERVVNISANNVRVSVYRLQRISSRSM